MPHLHLGLLAKRAGDLKTAHRELEQAGVLLPLEDASRILLLGGGFSREALVESAEPNLAPVENRHEHSCGAVGIEWEKGTFCRHAAGI